MCSIRQFHAHVYFDLPAAAQARELCQRVAERFAVRMGRVHERPVGPHPRGSCQLAFAADRFGDVIPWLALNRGGLVVFVHPDTGDALKDHTEHALWMGAREALDLSAFEGAAA